VEKQLTPLADLDAESLLVYIYHEFPKREGPTGNTIKKKLKNALVLYPPDKNAGDDLRW
jgi:hypothetical protein